MVFAGWGSWVARLRWPVLIVTLIAIINAGLWGLGVFGKLTEGGYNDPNSESTQAADVAQEAFGAQGGDLVVIYTPVKGKIDDAALGKRIKASLSRLPKSAVTSTASYWSAKNPQYAAKNKHSAVAVITLAGGDDAGKLESYRAIDDKFAVQGATVQLSGATALADASSARSTKDLGTAELISLPITLVLLVLIFGSLVAASLPVLVGGAAVAGSLGILHAISATSDVNSFAVNVASLLGLGMAIDYGLFMVGRFREEQAEGRDPIEAVSRTVGTAGRTVVFSATLLMIALAGLLLFPQGFLKSLAYGGLAAVFLAAVLSLTLLPALLAVLGPKVDKIPVRLPGRSGKEPGSGWRKLAGVVLKRPLLVAIPILGILLLLASPVRNVHFGESDERILPAGDPSRTAIETLKADYPQFTGDSVQIVLRNAQDSAAFAVALRQIPGISQIGPSRKQKGVTLFTATLKTKDAFSTEARDVVDAIRALPVPAGATLLVGGTTARNVDSLEATAERLPLMIGLLVGATLLLMFLAFGSVLLPIKAVLMSAISLSATFGVLVWIFQDGHGSDLLDISPAPLEVGIVVLMAAVVFGLSTDYEVFLLSRMVEARTRGASTNEAVTTGLARTGRVISAAALLLIVVTGAFALSAVTTMRFVGVGMIIALLLDATVVRMLLVPAILRLLGDAAWWAPGPLRRLQQRAGLSEYAGEQPADEPAGRHAAPDDTQVIRYAPYGSGSHALPATAAARSGAAEPIALPGAPEAVALPGAPAAFALPAAPMDDSTQVFARFEDTAVLRLPALSPDPHAGADIEEVEAEAVPDFSRTALPAPDDDTILDAEILEDSPVDAETSWGLSPAPAEASIEPGRIPPADLTSLLPAVPEFEPKASWAKPDPDGFFFGAPAASSPAQAPLSGPPSSPSTPPVEEEAVALPAFAEAEAEPRVPAEQQVPSEPRVPAEPFADVSAEPAEASSVGTPAETAEAPSFDIPAEAEAEDFTRPAQPISSADSFSRAEPIADAEPEPEVFADAASETVASAFVDDDEDDAEAQVEVEARVEGESEAEVELEAGEVSPAVVDEPVAEEPVAEEPVADEPVVEEPVAEEPVVEEPVAQEPVAEEPFVEEPFVEEPFDYEAAAQAFGYEPVRYEPFVPSFSEPFDDTYVPAAPLDEPAPTVDLSERAGRPATLADTWRPGRADGQTSTPRGATLGDQPLPRRPIPSRPEPQPMTDFSPPAPPAGPATSTTASPAPGSVPSTAPAEQPVQNIEPGASVPVHPDGAPSRRPADLADHLRESRPADLSDYTAGKVPRMRRPAEPPAPVSRRPATLADHLSTRKPSSPTPASAGPGTPASPPTAGDDTHDLRDHARRD
ncbi:MMPL family transporter [Actinoplanes sp. CA-030573]|uniref:MMPL family transporter n=1 Tax=Actinoplanes sp. CA-030573 TaxID=3239898 RepID=UPI003D8FFA44